MYDFEDQNTEIQEALNERKNIVYVFLSQMPMQLKRNVFPKAYTLLPIGERQEQEGVCICYHRIICGSHDRNLSMFQLCDVIVENTCLFFILLLRSRKHESERAKMKPSWEWYTLNNILWWLCFNKYWYLSTSLAELPKCAFGFVNNQKYNCPGHYWTEYDTRVSKW